MPRKRTGMAALAVAAVLTGTAGAAFGADCVVADPTGTPLNVRSGPQGRVLSVLDNGMTVEILDERALGGKRWAKVAADGEVLGWVFAAYLDCTMADDNTKSAPMRPRTPPQ
ncbi:SH3 domain-containing protein [Pararhizobium sp. YC-54]|uniref:SH3 domain-containing protein n=1 Tax=Pararhizobium sp. YC-54 TaxID=2986920 RepID=UPI0021F7E66F|nr:SH3 domain-containing protein [Pararhizobium sp. YC-54]MCW0001289.1 SH3 domain-containing protein [Pararhizobium sp. YC-54]